MEKSKLKKKYQKIEKLGEGTFGRTFKAKSMSCLLTRSRGEDIETGEIVALLGDVFESSEEGIPAQALRQIAILKSLNHPHIVRFIDVICSKTKRVLVLEYLYTTLKRGLDNAPLVPPLQIKARDLTLHTIEVASPDR